MIKLNRAPELVIWLAIAGWSLLLFASAGWNLYNTEKQTRAIAANEARVLYNRTLTTISWVAIHGGVYVPATKLTEPNPFLSHIPERDIITPSGKKLTLMNSAYMLRQMSQVFETLFGVKGHITSLKNVRPETAPDDWEKKALKRFDAGDTEVMEFSSIDGKSFLRLMRPLYVKDECLKCHGWQG